jgi:hypothetical protein
MTMAVADAVPRRGAPTRWSRLLAARAGLIGRQIDEAGSESPAVPVTRVDRITQLIGPRGARGEDELVAACEQAAGSGGEESCLVLDLTVERSLDPATARRVAQLSTRLAERGGGLAVVARSPGVLAALAEAGRGTTVPSFPTRAEALAAVPGRLTARTSAGVLAHRRRPARLA